jgi:type I restriction enzyme S subunit
MEAVWTDALNLSERRPFDEVSSGYTRFREGDVLLPKITPTFEANRSAIAQGLEGGIGTGTTELHVLRPRPIMNARYLLYAISSSDFLQRGHADMYGVAGQKRISEDFVKNYTILVPSMTEQLELVEFLHSKTSRIDGLVAEQRSAIELLWERRRASVFDAVTGRSIPGPRRQGVPWVDSIPSGWSAAKLTSVAQLGSGHTPSRSRPELWMDCTIPWVTTGEVWQIRSDEKEVLTETREMISQRGIAESSAVIHPAGTVVLCRTAASAGFSAIMGTDMTTSQDFATWTCGPRLLPDYLLFCLRAMRSDLLGRLAMGSTHRTIYMPEIKSIVVPLPMMETQERIVKELRETVQELDTLRHEMTEQIALLREHRQALITAAVTGDPNLHGSAA